MRQEPSAAPAVVRVTGHAGNPPGQGPFIRITLGVAAGFVREAAYETYQCPGCHACGKAICELTSGRTLESARELRHEDLVARVGPLERHRQICYGLAMLALHDALARLGGQLLSV